MPDLYVITTVSLRQLPRSRTVGIFESREQAEQVLIKDLGDLNEAGYYPHAIIEKIGMGLYPWPQQVSVWKYRDGAWLQCSEQPEEVKEYLSKVVGFCSIG